VTLTARILAIGCLVSVFGCDVGSESASADGSEGGVGSASGAGAEAGAGAAAAAGIGSASGAGSAAGGSTGASAGAAATGGGGSGPGGSFTLLYRDDFDTLDLTRWQLMTHSWDTNLALFSSEAVSVAGGNLLIRLLPAPSGTVDDSGQSKSFLGAEVRSRDTLTYGRVRARARLAKGSAVVSSLVTIYTPWPADNWNELDVECLGKDPADLQYNAMVYMGPPTTPPVSQSVSPTADPQKVRLSQDPSADFHVYAVEWTPTSARFLVDDVEQRVWTTHIDRMTLPQNVLMTIWASSSSAWAGAVAPETSMAAAAYDWIELYRYNAP